MAVFVPAAGAEVGASVPTVQAVAADAAWLAYAPAPAVPGVVCMVDSGVDPNPDTETAVVGGQALSPDTDTFDEVAALAPRVQPGDHPDGHGTLMAMMMSAPRNGWGMVGIAPTPITQVYNMKALPAGHLTFPPEEFALAVQQCELLRKSAYRTMTVINLSLGGEPAPEGNVLDEFERAVASAREAGMSVVAAAGDTGEGVLFPASDRAQVLAVGGADAGAGPGMLCSFSSRGEGLLLAPGCDNATGGLEAAFEDSGEPAYGSGDSQASAEVSAIEAAIDAYNPALTPAQTEACLTSTAHDEEVDAAAAFAACGLEWVVSTGQSTEAAATFSNAAKPAADGTASTLGACASTCAATESPTPQPPVSSFEPACPTPRLHVKIAHRWMRLQAGGRPAQCQLQARVGFNVHGETLWRHTYTSNSSVLNLPASMGGELQARLYGRREARLPSAWVPVRVGRT